MILDIIYYDIMILIYYDSIFNDVVVFVVEWVCIK